MFLALNEIKYEKSRFILIIGIIFLISYLVFFLTGLAYGLASSYSDAINSWNSDYIIYSKESNDNISMSMIKNSDLKSIKATELAKLSSSPAIIRNTKENLEKNVNANIFAIEKESFISPKIIEGRIFNKDDEVTADITLKEEGFKIGDSVYFAGEYDKKVTIVGFTSKTRFQVSPVIHGSFNFFYNYRFGTNFDKDNSFINAIIAKGENITIENNNLKLMPINDYIFKLPGYNAQVLTFGLMISFLVLISALIIGIFIYILTMQKINMFGVMKAQGITNSYISIYVITKTLLISFIALSLGLTFTILTSLFLPNTVPFLMNKLFFLIIGVSFLFFALIGAIFSVRMTTRIDPLTAMRI